MVKTREIVVKKYKRGIERIGGAPKYYECGKEAEKGPAINVAKCLQAAKRSKTTEDFVNAYEEAMFGTSAGY